MENRRWSQSIRWNGWYRLLFALGLATHAQAQFGADPRMEKPGASQNQPSASLPALLPPPVGAALFQPGIWIDWKQPAVVIDGRVAQTNAPLEFLACFPGKEHESLLVLAGRATGVFQALGLIGITNGAACLWDETQRRFRPPSGDLVDVSVEWDAAPGDRRTVSIWQWTRLRRFAERPIARPLVFGGSKRIGEGRLAADVSGAGIAVVDMPDALLGLTRSFGSQDADLWLVCDPTTAPPAGTPVRVRLRAAEKMALAVHIDFRGDVFVNNAWTEPQDAADLVALARQIEPARVQTITVHGALDADVRRVRRVFEHAGLRSDALRWVTQSVSSNPASRP